MPPDSARRRAPAMTPDQRRTEIVRAALPLLTAHGANVTTRQIAHAAEIAEGTVFRVFADKDELLRACVHEAFRTDEVCARISELETEDDLDARLVEAGVRLVEHFKRLGGLIQALSTSGYVLHPSRHDHDASMEFFRVLTDACCDLLAPERPRLRVPIAELARMMLGLLMSMRFEPDREIRAGVALRIDTVLRGALTSTESPQPDPEPWGERP